MGNIRGWGGPLSKSWIDSQANLTQAILNRQRQFGMTPVLPAFAGHVPEAVTHLFPQGNFTRAERWNGFGVSLKIKKKIVVEYMNALCSYNMKFFFFDWIVKKNIVDSNKSLG